MPTYNQFGWAHPDFSTRQSEPSSYDRVQQAKQRTRQYAKRAPKKSLRKKPRTNYGSYQWDKGMTFEEKARMLAGSGNLFQKYLYSHTMQIYNFGKICVKIWPRIMTKSERR